MISSLIDELRKSADEWNGSNMFELARMCREAADTIWQLRDDLQRANAENARLRSELESVGTAAYLYGRGDLKAENAKLRDLVAQMYPRAKAFLQMGVQLGCNDTLSYDWELQMQELGIEVPE